MNKTTAITQQDNFQKELKKVRRAMKQAQFWTEVLNALITFVKDFEKKPHKAIDVLATIVTAVIMSPLWIAFAVYHMVAILIVVLEIHLKFSVWLAQAFACAYSDTILKQPIYPHVKKAVDTHRI